MRSPVPTRRGFLSGLASLPVGATMTLPAFANEPPDADLIRHAQQVASLARAEWVAVNQRADAEARYEEHEPKRPTFPSGIPSQPPVPEPSSAEMRTHLARAEQAPQAPGTLDAFRARIARVDAYEAACAALILRCGLRAAERKADRAARRLEDSARRLTPMAPTTPQGLKGKAVAVIAAFDGLKHCEHPTWLLRLSEATLRDAITIGGGA